MSEAKIHSDLIIFDGLIVSNWGREIFENMREGGLTGANCTCCVWENFSDTMRNISNWKSWIQENDDLLCQAYSTADIRQAKQNGKTAIVLGFQNVSAFEDQIGYVRLFKELGVGIVQMAYNTQNLIGSGCYETTDSGLTDFGREIVAEMNRVGLVVDMSHSADRSTLEAIEISARPIAITHANPSWWHAARRNKSHEVIKALTQAGGMIGFSIYPHHLKDASACSLDSFCEMIARAADAYGISSLGIGSDLCQGQPNEVVEWMRNGRWSKTMDYGEGSADDAGFPPQPHWFETITHFPNIANGLSSYGFSDDDVAAVMGANWLRFYDENFGPK